MRARWALSTLLLLANSETLPLSWRGQPVQGGVLRGEVRGDVAGVTLRAPDGTATPAAVTDGVFMIAFDRDAPPVEELVATLHDGREQVFTLAIAPRAWRIERVDAPYRPPAFDSRRPAELARIVAARGSDTGERGWLQPLGWPVVGPVRGQFGAQRLYRGVPGSYHAGIDIAAPTGTTVRAPAAGRVTLTADPPFTLEGRLVLIDHGGGLSSALMHLSRIDVREGQAVVVGESIGAVGVTGRATGPHLHWGLTWRGMRLDPVLVAGAMEMP